MSLTSIDLGLRSVFADREDTQEFFRLIAQDEIAGQIRDLRKKRGLTQAAVAQATDMKQSAVSRIEQAEHSTWTMTTLFRVAAALNGRVRFTLEPMEDALVEYLAAEAENLALAPTPQTGLLLSDYTTGEDGTVQSATYVEAASDYLVRDWVSSPLVFHATAATRINKLS